MMNAIIVNFPEKHHTMLARGILERFQELKKRSNGAFPAFLPFNEGAILCYAPEQRVATVAISRQDIPTSVPFG